MVFGYEGVSVLAFTLVAVGAFLCCAVAVGAGIGGGALYMPLYVFLTQDAHKAVPLSKVTTNAVAWSAFIFNVFQEHPTRGGPMIDYDVTTILEPLTLVGTIVGVVLNVYLSSAQIVVALVLVLVPTAITTLKKGFELRRKEQEAPEARDAPLVAGGQEARPEEKTRFPPVKIFSLLGNFAVHATLLLLAGGPTSIVCGNSFQRSMLVLLGTFHLAFTLLWRGSILKHAGPNRDTAGYQLDSATTLTKPLLSFVAGVCAGGLGIAAGLIMGPIMLQWGMLPQAAAATGIFTVLFTSTSTILQYTILKRVALVPSVVVWIIGFAGGLVGSFIVKKLMSRFGKQWMISVFLGILIVVSCLFMSSISVASMAGLLPDTPQEPICGVHNTSFQTTEWFIGDPW